VPPRRGSDLSAPRTVFRDATGAEAPCRWLVLWRNAIAGALALAVGSSPFAAGAEAGKGTFNLGRADLAAWRKLDGTHPFLLARELAHLTCEVATASGHTTLSDGPETAEIAVDRTLRGCRADVRVRGARVIFTSPLARRPRAGEDAADRR
jgi:hypothetical protein